MSLLMVNTKMYQIMLAGGKVWTLGAMDEAEAWLFALASAMRLPPCPVETPPDLLFILRHDERLTAGELAASLPAISSSRPSGKWRARVCPGVAFYSHPDVPHIVCCLTNGYGLRFPIEQMRRSLLPVFEGGLKRGGIPLHAALVARGGEAVLLTGKSGAGKSTSCRRLPQTWEVLSDDMALVVQITDGVYRVHPVPTWSAIEDFRICQSWAINRHVSLRAIFFLDQAARDEVFPLRRAEAAVGLYDASSVCFETMSGRFNSPEGLLYRKLVFANATSLAATVPAYRLHVSLTGRFWEKIEEVLEKGTVPLFVQAGMKRNDRNG